jgi:hypothetical protein
MKNLTKLLLALACVCLLFACSKNTDDPAISGSQPSLKNGNSSEIIYVSIENWSMNIECNGVSDELVGSWTAHVVCQYKDGVEFREIQHWSGELISLNTGEIFKFKRHDQGDWDPESYLYLNWTGKVNLIGNNGTHYLATYTLNIETQELEITSASCF